MVGPVRSALPPTSTITRNAFAVGAVALVLFMTSGQMWNHIRGAPLMQRGRGQNTYIYASSSGQFVVETFLVMLINAGIAIGMLLTTNGLRTGDRGANTSKKFKARLGFGMMFVSFSLLLAVFRQKSYGYPYKLLF